MEGVWEEGHEQKTKLLKDTSGREVLAVWVDQSKVHVSNSVNIFVSHKVAQRFSLWSVSTKAVDLQCSCMAITQPFDNHNQERVAVFPSAELMTPEHRHPIEPIQLHTVVVPCCFAVVALGVSLTTTTTLVVAGQLLITEDTQETIMAIYKGSSVRLPAVSGARAAVQFGQ